MTEKLFLGLILILFVSAFAIKNIKTHLSTKQRIGGNSKKLTLSFSASTLFYLLILSRLTFLKPEWILEINFPESPVFEIFGLIMVLIGFLIGIFAFIAMKDSWRIAIQYDQKTELITQGVYRISRNPYFLSYDILFLGYLFFFPSIILIILYLCLIIVFHYIILEEEKYLESKHANTYLEYKKRVNRYLTIR
jgi:protein-S-isoprenylcysteine O-methyltransferase Ste14